MTEIEALRRRVAELERENAGLAAELAVLRERLTAALDVSGRVEEIEQP